MHYCSKFKLVLIFGFLPTLDNKLIKAKWLETTDAKVNCILYNVSKLSSSLTKIREGKLCVSSSTMLSSKSMKLSEFICIGNSTLG